MSFGQCRESWHSSTWVRAGDGGGRSDGHGERHGAPPQSSWPPHSCAGLVAQTFSADDVPNEVGAPVFTDGQQSASGAHCDESLHAGKGADDDGAGPVGAAGAAAVVQPARTSQPKMP